jgi:hypothetical protein
MALTANTVTVDTTAGGVPVFTPSGGVRYGVILFNNGAVTIYVGPSGVSNTTGIPVAAGASLSLDEIGDAIYAKAASSSADVRFLAWGKS